MGKEEQTEEREVLDSIFPDEITDVSDTEYRVTIRLDTPNEHDEETEAPIIILSVRYPDAYPDEAPFLDISAPPNAPKHRYLDIQDDKSHLLALLTPVIEENMGMAMVFSLISAAKDGAELLIADRAAQAQAARDVEAARAEEEENRKFHGTAVTRKSFLEWRERFRREMAEAEARRVEEKEGEEKKRRVVKEERRLTGKELWERGLASRVEEDEEDGNDALERLKDLKLEA